MSNKKMITFGGESDAGKNFTEEALKRGYMVTAIVTDKTEFTLQHPNLTVIYDNVVNKDEVSEYAKGHHVVVVFHEPKKEDLNEHVEIARNYIEGTKQAGVPQLIAVGHRFNTSIGNKEEVYAAIKALKNVQQEVLGIFKNEKELNWNYALSSEPEKIEGEQEPQISADMIICHSQGEQRVKPKNFTEALLNEAEKNMLEFHEQNDEDVIRPEC